MQVEHDQSIQWPVYIIARDASGNVLFTTEAISVDPIKGQCVWENVDGSWLLANASSSANCEFFLHVHLQPTREEERGSIFWFAVKIGYSGLSFGSSSGHGSFHALNRTSSSDKRLSFKKTVSPRCRGQYTCSPINNRLQITLLLNYAADRRIKNLQGWPEADFEILSMVMSMEPGLKDYLSAVQQETHRVVCLAQLRERNEKTKQMVLHNVYFGRPQKIVTSPENDRRSYYWNTQQQNQQDATFPGVCLKESHYWQQHVKQHDEMLLLKVFSDPLTARGRVGSSRTYIPDNDLYSNEIRVAPIHMRSGQSLSIKLYNLNGESDGYSMDVVLQWADFASTAREEQPKTARPASPVLVEQTTPRLKLSKKKSATPETEQKIHSIFKMLRKHLMLTVDYMSFENEVVTIVSLSLRAEAYQETLKFKNDYLIKSI